MRTIAWLILGAGLGLAAGAPNGDPPDQKKLQGAWQVIVAERDGKPSDEYKKFTFIFEGEAIMIKGPDAAREGKFKLSPTQNPKQITIAPLDFKVAMPGIYRFEDEGLRLCLGDLGKDRPTTFATKPGSRAVLLLLRRERP